MSKKKLSKSEQEIFDLFNEEIESEEIYELFKKESKKKIKKVSKTELKLKNKIAYAQSIARKKKKLFNDFIKQNTDKRKKVKANRNIDNYIKKGQSRSYKTMYNAVLNEVTKANSKTFALKQKIKKFKKGKKFDTTLKQNENRRLLGQSEQGRVWDSKGIEDAIFKDQKIKSVNGFDLKKDTDQVLDILNEFKQKMGAYETLWIYWNKKTGEGRLMILEDEFTKEIEK